MASDIHDAKPLAVCPSCATPLRGRFCHACGEKAFDPHDHSLKHFLQEWLHVVTHLDHAFFRSWQPYSAWIKTWVETEAAKTGLAVAVFGLVKVAGLSFNLEIPFLTALAVYLFFALRRVYQQHLLGAGVKGLLLAGATVLVLWVYRFALFLITFYTL